MCSSSGPKGKSALWWCLFYLCIAAYFFRQTLTPPPRPLLGSLALAEQWYSEPNLSEARAKWYASEEALWEIEGLQAYTEALASHTMQGESVAFITAAFDLASQNLSVFIP